MCSETVPTLIERGGGALVEGETGTEVPLAQRVQHVAGVLAARGFGGGDVLALWAPNVPPWAGVALGAMAAGGAVTGIHAAATDREVAVQRAAARASVLVTVPGLAERAPDALVITPDLLALPTAPVTAPPTADTVAFLPFSSGTTGLPKPVPLTHRNLTAAMRQVQDALRLTRDDTVLALPPFCHVMGFVVTLAAPLGGRCDRRHGQALGPRADRPPQDHRAGRAAAADGVARPLGARLPEPAADRVRRRAARTRDPSGAWPARFPHAVVAQGYGMTETAVAISGPDGRRPTPLGSVGVPMAGTEVKIVDGELWVRGPQVMTDGWLRTGDLAERDEQAGSSSVTG